MTLSVKLEVQNVSNLRFVRCHIKDYDDDDDDEDICVGK